MIKRRVTSAGGVDGSSDVRAEFLDRAPPLHLVKAKCLIHARFGN